MSEGFGRDRQALRESLIVTGDFHRAVPH